MTERPILFSGPMVRAILDGRKTQTRRVMTPQPFFDDRGLLWWHWSKHAGSACVQPVGTPSDEWLARCPYGVPGDHLWVRETTYDVERNGYVGPVFVESDEGANAASWGWGESDDPDYIEPYELRKRPAIHMPRAMARITLEITGVRVESLQAISEADAIAEGIEQAPDGFSVDGGRHFHASSARESFASLWDGLNAERGHGWEKNPWVWVVEFRRITP